MVQPLPQPGQVIRYVYLWWNEARLGREDGIKDRPCGVVLTRVNNSGNTVAYVLPITHTPPLKDEDGIEIPQTTKRRLGLDAERSWIVTTELNQFAWPGPDIRPTASGEYLYGYLPEKLMRLVLEQVKTHARDRQLKTVPRRKTRWSYDALARFDLPPGSARQQLSHAIAIESSRRVPRNSMNGRWNNRVRRTEHAATPRGSATE
jgi:hypothetical protein